VQIALGFSALRRRRSMLSPSGTLSGFSNILRDGHTGIPAPLHAAERKSKIRAEETGDHSSLSSEDSFQKVS
jgi:hypothetical protein